MLAAPLTTNSQRAEGEQLDGLTARLTRGSAAEHRAQPGPVDLGPNAPLGTGQRT